VIHGSGVSASPPGGTSAAASKATIGMVGMRRRSTDSKSLNAALTKNRRLPIASKKCDSE
jgi:hypothetical protein